MSGIVIEDLGVGDLAWHVVDARLWAQISRIRYEDKPGWREWISWLALSANESDRPEGCPEKAGLVLREFFTQQGVVEKFTYTGRITEVLVI